jgi:hypothetical protein
LHGAADEDLVTPVEAGRLLELSTRRVQELVSMIVWTNRSVTQEICQSRPPRRLGL